MTRLPLRLAAAWIVLAAWVSPATAAPASYQATGQISALTDSTITILYHGKEPWTFSRDAAVKPPDGAELKVGDKVTVHYFMTAAAIEISKPTREHKAPMDKPKASSTPSPAAATPVASPSPGASPLPTSLRP